MQIPFKHYLRPQSCIISCQILGYAYAVVAGLKQGCFCQQQPPSSGKVEEDNCLSPCQSGPTFSCGNFPYGHVYKTGILLVIFLIKNH